MKSKDKALISISTQHNKLIEARYSMTLQEKRLILWLVSKIHPLDEKFKVYKVAIRDLAKFIKLEPRKNIYRDMLSITRRIMTRVIEIEEPENEKILQVNWLCSAEYLYGEGYVILEFSEKLRPYLLQIKNNFTKLQLSAALSLSSVYAVRIYELLKQYEKLKVRTISLTELRRFLAMKKDDYVLYGNFKAKVLQIAQREINSKTDLRIEIQEIKESRRVVKLRFHITPNPNYHETEESLETTPFDESIEVSSDLINKLRYFGISKKKVLELVITYGEKIIQVKLQDFEKAIDIGKQINNPAGWLLSAIEKDWNYRSPYQIEQERQEQAENERLEKERLKSAEKAKKELELRHYKLAFDSHMRALFWPRWNTLSQEQQEQLATQVISNPVEQRSYNKKGAESPVVLAKLLPHVLSPEELDFESWYASRSV